MTAINAYDFDGASGSYAILPSGLGHSRTGAGFEAETQAVIVKFDTVAHGQDATILASKRASNDNVNHMMMLDDSANSLEYQYNSIAQFNTGTDSIAAATWYLVARVYAGGTGDVTIYVIPLSTATTSASDSGASGGSSFSDSETQEYTLGGHEVGGTVFGELNGQIACVLIVKGAALSQANLEAFAADPLNYGDSVVQTYGADAFFWDDSGVDSGPNDLAAPTLVGGVTYGSGNGPDITERPSPEESTAPTITSVGTLGLAIIYEGQQRVSVSGTAFGATEPAVSLTSDPDGAANIVAQTVRSSSDTALTFDCALGALEAGPLYLVVQNQTVGDDFGLLDVALIEVRPDPGSAVIAVLSSPPAVNLQSSVAVSEDASDYFYARHAQETADFSATNLPTGVAIDTATGVITGTLGSDAVYTPAVRLTDPNGDYAEQSFTWTIATPDEGEEVPGVPSTFPPRIGYARRGVRR